MIVANPLLGTLLHAIGATSAAVCYTPQKQVKGWSWQTYWMTQAAFCWLILPILGAYLTIPQHSWWDGFVSVRPRLQYLTFMPDFHMLPDMKTMFQGGLNGRVPVPPEKRFLIHLTKKP